MTVFSIIRLVVLGEVARETYRVVLTKMPLSYYPVVFGGGIGNQCPSDMADDELSGRVFHLRRHVHCLCRIDGLHSACDVSTRHLLVALSNTDKNLHRIAIDFTRQGAFTSKIWVELSWLGRS